MFYFILSLMEGDSGPSWADIFFNDYLGEGSSQGAIDAFTQAQQGRDSDRGEEDDE